MRHEFEVARAVEQLVIAPLGPRTRIGPDRDVAAWAAVDAVVSRADIGVSSPRPT